MSSGDLTLACALESEERVARKAGARTARVGLRASLPAPEGPIAAFGLAGALVPGLEPGTLLTARRIVDEQGAVVWEGEPIAVPGAEAAVLCAADRVVDDPAERRSLAERTGAVAVEMESAVLARTGRLAGSVRAVVDGPERRVGRLAGASTPQGGVAWGVVVGSFITEPVVSARTAVAARRALASLERAAAALAGGAS
ncbi:MAG: hypothetical protein R3C15_03845 [Thermoleophilia bacterium]